MDWPEIVNSRQFVVYEYSLEQDPFRIFCECDNTIVSCFSSFPVCSRASNLQCLTSYFGSGVLAVCTYTLVTVYLKTFAMFWLTSVVCGFSLSPSIFLLLPHSIPLQNVHVSHTPMSILQFALDGLDGNQFLIGCTSNENFGWARCSLCLIDAHCKRCTSCAHAKMKINSSLTTNLQHFTASTSHQFNSYFIFMWNLPPTVYMLGITGGVSKWYGIRSVCRVCWTVIVIAQVVWESLSRMHSLAQCAVGVGRKPVGVMSYLLLNIQCSHRVRASKLKLAQMFHVQCTEKTQRWNSKFIQALHW